MRQPLRDRTPPVRPPKSPAVHTTADPRGVGSGDWGGGMPGSGRRSATRCSGDVGTAERPGHRTSPPPHRRSVGDPLRRNTGALPAADRPRRALVGRSRAACAASRADACSRSEPRAVLSSGGPSADGEAEGCGAPGRACGASGDVAATAVACAPDLPLASGRETDSQ